MVHQIKTCEGETQSYDTQIISISMVLSIATTVLSILMSVGDYVNRESNFLNLLSQRYNHADESVFT